MMYGLCRLSIRFRLQNLVFTANTEKAFLQVGLRPQGDVTWDIWVEDMKKNSFELWKQSVIQIMPG